jgi:hypothetical protein
MTGYGLDDRGAVVRVSLKQNFYPIDADDTGFGTHTAYITTGTKGPSSGGGIDQAYKMAAAMWNHFMWTV